MILPKNSGKLHNNEINIEEEIVIFLLIFGPIPDIEVVNIKHCALSLPIAFFEVYFLKKKTTKQNNQYNNSNSNNDNNNKYDNNNNNNNNNSIIIIIIKQNRLFENNQR